MPDVKHVPLKVGFFYSLVNLLSSLEINTYLYKLNQILCFSIL